jgi:hypothetical protein
LHFQIKALRVRIWRFFDYCSEAGNNVIERWYHDQSVEVQADFDVTLAMLAGFRDWRNLTEFKMLAGKHTGMGEIRFRSERVQYRPVGTFGLGSSKFLLLIGACKKGNVYKPPDAFDLAFQRKKLFFAGKGSMRERYL